jgi:hypothetical protein
MRCAVLRSAKLFSAEKVDLPTLIKEEHAPRRRVSINTQYNNNFSLLISSRPGAASLTFALATRVRSDGRAKNC